MEEKQYQINRPKYYGWYSHQLSQVSALKCRLKTKGGLFHRTGCPMEGWSFYSLPHKLTLSLGVLQSMLSLIQKPAKSLKKWPLSWNRPYLIWPSTLNMALTSKMTNLHTGANLSMPLYSKSTLVRMLIFREKGGVHWEGGSAHVRERLRQEVVIKALHQVAPGSIHFPHLATRC